jgi:hypothetical protein
MGIRRNSHFHLSGGGRERDESGTSRRHHALSANGQQAGSGIVWSYARAPANGAVGGVTEIMPGILRAYDASNVNHLLCTSQQNIARDDAGLFGKFSVPTVVNGTVYLGTNSNQVVVYGLLPTGPSFTLKAYPPRALALGGNATFTISPFKANGFGETLSYSVSAGLPTGASASFSAAAADGSVTLSITTSASTPKGLFALTVRAAGTTQSKLQEVLLEVDGSVSAPFAQRSIRAADSEEPLPAPSSLGRLEGARGRPGFEQRPNPRCATRS